METIYESGQEERDVLNVSELEAKHGFNVVADFGENSFISVDFSTGCLKISNKNGFQIIGHYDNLCRMLQEHFTNDPNTIWGNVLQVWQEH